MSTSETPSKSAQTTEVATPVQTSVPSTPDSANVSLNVSVGESPATTPSGSGKGKTRRGKRKREPSLEDIYQNKLWRTQMPKDKNWETIFEEPKSKKGHEEYQSCKKYKRLCNFDDFYNQTRLKKRRQRALKRGWKPLTKKKDEKAGKLVEDKLMILDQELMEEEMPDTSISETLALLGEPLVSLSKEQQQHETSVSASPIKSVMSHCIDENKSAMNRDDSNKDTIADMPNTAIETATCTFGEIDKGIQENVKPHISITVEDVDNSTERNDSTKSLHSDVEYYTPNATLTKDTARTKESENEPPNLSAIGEDDDEMFFTPAAKGSKDNLSPKELKSTSEDKILKSPDSSDRSSISLSPTKTPARPEEIADISGVFSLPP